MKVCIFGGSFDPPHNAHIMLAEYLISQSDIDEVWLMVSPRNPLKDIPQSSFADRYAMCKLAVEHSDGVLVSDFEAGLKAPHYTYRTMLALKKAYPENEFSILIGTDNVAIFNHWKDYDLLLKDYKIYAYPRKGVEDCNLFPEIVRIIPPDQSDISSSQIRQRLKDNLPVRELINPEVERYIRLNKLY